MHSLEVIFLQVFWYKPHQTVVHHKCSSEELSIRGVMTKLKMFLKLVNLHWKFAFLMPCIDDATLGAKLGKCLCASLQKCKRLVWWTQMGPSSQVG